MSRRQVIFKKQKSSKSFLSHLISVLFLYGGRKNEKKKNVANQIYFSSSKCISVHGFFLSLKLKHYEAVHTTLIFVLKFYYYNN